MTRDVAAERAEIDAAVADQTVGDLFHQAVEAHGDRVALRAKTDGAWRTWTWRQYADEVRVLAHGLAALGFAPGEFANLLGANRPEYVFADIAILENGGTPVSLYNTLAPEQIEYIVNHCESVLVVVENAATYEKIAAIREKIPKVRHVVVMEGGRDLDAGDGWMVAWEDLRAAGEKHAAEHPKAIDERLGATKPEDLCTLIYTSGTTGPPKGVMITHHNVCWTAESAFRMMPTPPGMRQISYLPLAHIAERMVGHYLAMKGATEVSFCPDPRQIAEMLPDVRPEYFFAVPRIWEKIHDKIWAAIEGNPDESQRQTAKIAIEAGMQKVRHEQAGEAVPPEIAEKAQLAPIVGGMIRERVGLDQVTIAVTGAAPIARTVLEFFHAIGVEIAEVYGQSEDSGPTSWNRVGSAKIGTVGPAVPGVEVKLADDGELLVRGGNVSQGYYKEPELTAETFDAEGWLHSGDVAEIDDDGFIKIVDRKKEILITAGGKNVAPSNVEGLLKQHPLIGQACMIGDARPYCSALIVLDGETAPVWAKEKGLPTDLAALAAHDTVRAEIQGHVDAMNQKLHNQEQIKKFTVLPNEWTPDSGELTPTMKMKRKVVNQRYEGEIERMYG